MKYLSITKKLLATVIFLNIFGLSALTSLAATNSLYDAIMEGGMSTIGKDAYGLTDPKGPKEIPRIISDAIQVALGLIGSIFMALIFYSGFRWLASAGNDEVIKKSKGILIHSVIGLVIVLASYSITMFLIQATIFSTQAGLSETFMYEP